MWSLRRRRFLRRGVLVTVGAAPLVLLVAALCISREPLLVFSIVVAGFIALPAAAFAWLDVAGATDDRVLLVKGEALREMILGRVCWVLAGVYVVGYAAFLLGIVERS